MTSADATFLLGRPEFRRFLFAAIQTAGCVGITSPANGQSGRPLEFHEGRRSLGFELLQMVQRGQPDVIRNADPGALATLNAAILEALNPAPKEKPNGGRDDNHGRYDELPD